MSDESNPGLAAEMAENRPGLLAAALHAADNCVFITKVDGTIEWMNAAFTRQTGYSEAEALGRNPRLLDSKQQPRAYWQQTWETILAGLVWRGEFVNQRKDGSLYDLEMTISPVCDGGGRVERFIAVLEEITERKRMEGALRRSEGLYRAIGESIDYGVWVCAPDGRNTYASDSFLKLVGLTQKQCSDFGWGEVLHPEDSARTIAAWKECVRTGGTWDIEHRFRGVDGEYHHILARGAPVKDENGQILCWAGINLDISRLKKADAELQRRAQELSASNDELARFNQAMVGRELRMIELKQEVNDLCARIGQPPRYVFQPGSEPSDPPAA